MEYGGLPLSLDGLIRVYNPLEMQAMGKTLKDLESKDFVTLEGGPYGILVMSGSNYLNSLEDETTMYADEEGGRFCCSSC